MPFGLKQDTGAGYRKEQPTGSTFKPKEGASSPNYGAWAAAAGTVISGYFDSRAQDKQAQASLDAQKLDAKTTVHMEQSARKHALEDRRYLEEGARAFRDKYQGNRPVMAPDLTDPSTVVVTDPFKKK